MDSSLYTAVFSWAMVDEEQIMTNTTYTLQLVPSGYKVVPEEPDGDVLQSIEIAMAVSAREDRALGAYRAIMEAAPPINTSPVLRWEGRFLIIGNKELAYIWSVGDGERWVANICGGAFNTEQEARRAAEKALGFPDGLVIEEV